MSKGHKLTPRGLIMPRGVTARGIRCVCVCVCVCVCLFVCVSVPAVTAQRLPCDEN